MSQTSPPHIPPVPVYPLPADCLWAELPVVLYRVNAQGIITHAEGKGWLPHVNGPSEAIGKAIGPFLGPFPDAWAAYQQARAGTPGYELVLAPKYGDFEAWFWPQAKDDEDEGEGEGKEAGHPVLVLNLPLDPKTGYDQELVRAKQRLELALDVAELCVFELDAQTGRLNWLPSTYQLFGLSPQTFTPTIEGVAAFVLPEDRERVLTTWRNTLADPTQKALRGTRFRIRRADGQIRNLVCSQRVARHQDGSPRYVFGLLQDETERLYQQAESEAQSRRAELLLEASGLAFAELDAQFCITYTNTKARTLLAERAGTQQLMGQSIWALFEDFEATPFPALYRRVMHRREPEQLEGFYPAYDTWFRVKAFPSGAGIGIFFDDITAEKRAEQQAQAAQRRAELLLDSTHLAFFGLDADFCYTYANRAARTIVAPRLQAQDHDLVGQCIWDLVPDAETTEAANLYRQVMRTRQPGKLEEFFGGPGFGRWYSNSVFPTEEGIGVFVEDITERKLQELAVQRAQLILDSTDLCFYTLDEAFRITYINPAFQSWIEDMGSERVKVGRHLFDEVLPTLEDTPFGAAYKRVMATGGSQQVEAYFAPFSTWWRATCFRLPDGVGIFFEDINDKKEAERQARLESERTKRLLNHTEYAFFGLDEDYRITVFNNQALGLMEHFNPELDEFVGQLVWDLLPDGIRQHPFGKTWMQVMGDGESRWVEAFYEPLQRWYSGQVFRTEDGLGVLFQDVTDRKAQEEALAKANQHANDLVDHNDQAFVAWDSQWRYQYLNDAAAALIQRGKDEVLGRNFWAVFPDLVGTPVEEAYRYVMERRLPRRQEVHYPTYDVWFDLNIFPITGGGVGVYFNDITDRKRREEGLAQLNETKNRLFSLLAHDLRGPFTKLDSLTQMADIYPDAMSKDDLLGYLRDVNRSTQELRHMLNNLLGWMGMMMQRNRLDLAPLDPTPLAQRVIDFFRAEASPRNLELHMPDGPLAVLADEQALEAVVRNLVANALKYTDPKQGQISVRLAHTPSQANPAGPGLVTLTVEDNGLGMSAELAKAISTGNVEGSTPSLAGELGSGLGLRLCRELVLKMNGALHVSTTLGKGSAFTVELPAA